MIDKISKHTSNIAVSAIKYLKSVKVSGKTRKMYENVLFFFIESLLSDPSAVTEDENGELVLSDDWNAYYGGAIDNFIDWWLPRKVMDDTLQIRAPGILRKWIVWCHQQNYFDDEHYEDFLEALPQRKSKEVKRLQKAADLLYHLHTPNPGAWLTGETDNIIPITRGKQPDALDEGYMQVTRLEKDYCHLKTEEGKEIEPVKIGVELAKTLKVGDVVNVTVGRYGQYWNVLESGNVYGDKTLF